MAGFPNLKSVADGLQTKLHYATWRKTPAVATTAGIWFDTSMSPGNPVPQYYASSPLVAKVLARSGDYGIDHGSNAPSGQSKFLNRFLILSGSATGLPMPYILCDYLLYYPFVDMGSADEQMMDNTAVLTRNTSGVGNQIMIVSVAPNISSNVRIGVSYVDSNDVTQSSIFFTNLATVNGSITSSNNGANLTSVPFIPLNDGVIGVKSIISAQITAGTDVGLFSIVIVKPITTGVILEQTAASDNVVLPFKSVLPKIDDDAFLGLVTLPNGSLASVPFHGEIETVTG